MWKLLLVAILLSPFAFVDGYSKMKAMGAINLYYFLLFLWIGYVSLLVILSFKKSKENV